MQVSPFLGIGTEPYQKGRFYDVFLALFLPDSDGMRRGIVLPSKYLKYPVFSTNTKILNKSDLAEVSIVTFTVVPFLDLPTEEIYVSLTAQEDSVIQAVVLAEEDTITPLAVCLDMLENLHQAGLVKIYASKLLEDLKNSLTQARTRWDSSKHSVEIPYLNSAPDLANLRFTYYHFEQIDFLKHSVTLEESIGALTPVPTNIFVAGAAYRSARGKTTVYLRSREIDAYIAQEPVTGREDWILPGTTELIPKANDYYKLDLRGLWRRRRLDIADTPPDVRLIHGITLLPNHVFAHCRLGSSEAHLTASLQVIKDLSTSVKSLRQLQELTIEYYNDKLYFEVITDVKRNGFIEVLPKILELVTEGGDGPQVIETLLDILDSSSIPYRTQADGVRLDHCKLVVKEGSRYSSLRSPLPEDRAYFDGTTFHCTATAAETGLGYLYPSEELVRDLILRQPNLDKVNATSGLAPRILNSLTGTYASLSLNLQLLFRAIDEPSLLASLEARGIHYRAGEVETYPITREPSWFSVE